jgi:hypothetical protein
VAINLLSRQRVKCAECHAGREADPNGAALAGKLPRGTPEEVNAIQGISA